MTTPFLKMALVFFFSNNKEKVSDLISKSLLLNFKFFPFIMNGSEVSSELCSDKRIESISSKDRLMYC